MTSTNEETCEIEIVKSGAIYTTYRTTCCGFKWAVNDCDSGVSDNPEFKYCPGCGTKIKE